MSDVFVYQIRILGKRSAEAPKPAAGHRAQPQAKQVQRGSHGDAVHNPRRKSRCWRASLCGGTARAWIGVDKACGWRWIESTTFIHYLRAWQRPAWGRTDRAHLHLPATVCQTDPSLCQTDRGSASSYSRLGLAARGELSWAELRRTTAAGSGRLRACVHPLRVGEAKAEERGAEERGAAR
jgi:hypothetical protein